MKPVMIELTAEEIIVMTKIFDTFMLICKDADMDPPASMKLTVIDLLEKIGLAVIAQREREDRSGH